MAPFTGWLVTDVLKQVPGSPSLEQVDVVQPVCFAVMVALAGLWEHHACTRTPYSGHSQGEIAAACVAGALSMHDAARIVALRSQAIARHVAGHGAMLLIALPQEQILPWLAPFDDELQIAVINSPIRSWWPGTRTPSHNCTRL